MFRSRTLNLVGLVAVLLALVAGLPGTPPARAQGNITPLRVETAVTGTLTAAQPTVVYSFNAVESLRMGFVFDLIDGDMQVTIVVLDQDQATTLAGAAGPNVNGVVVEFPTSGTYYVGLTGEAGTSATYRLFIDADPPLPIDPFILQSYLVAGTSNRCSENTLVSSFSTQEDLNACFSVDLITTPIQLEAQWWSPTGEVVSVENLEMDSSMNGTIFLTGLVYQNQPWTSGWWQVHLLLNGELAYIQWVPVIQ